MSAKRVSLLNLHSLRAFSKVCSSRHSSKCLSTAPEFADFHGYSRESGPERNQPATGFSGVTRNRIDYELESNQQGINPREGFREGADKGFVRNNNVNFGNDSNGLYQGSGGVYERKTISENQNSTSGKFGVYDEENSARSYINSNGVNTNSSSGAEYNSRGFYQNHSVRAQNSWGMQYAGNGSMQHERGSFGERPVEVRQSANGFSSERFPQPHGKLDENNMQNNRRIQQSQYNPSTGNGDMYQQSPNFNQYLPNPNAVQHQQNSDNIHDKPLTSEMSSSPYAQAPESSSNNVSVEDLDGFCKEGNVKEAVEVLEKLEKQGIYVDLPRMLELMKACGDEKSLKEAKTVHEYVLRTLSPLEVRTYNRILEMYSQCGSMNDAFGVFDTMPARNLTSWDTMITWLARNGLGEDALDLFTQFKKEGFKPDGQMFIQVFFACSVVGDVNEGMLHFEAMSNEYGIIPSMEHYVSIVEMMGSVGYLDEALEFVERLPIQPSVDVWGALMKHCRIHGHLELGDRCAELVEQLDPSCLCEQSKAGLIPLKASDLAKGKEKKSVSQNLLEVKSRVHEYRAGDKSHPESDKIYAMLRCLKEQMKEVGYVPETRFVLHDIDQEGKEEALLSHSERLAVAQGLMTTAARSPIRIIKNLRFCGDCHAVMKIVSKLVGRELIIRDAKRFHHFKDGVCSCRDYW